MTFRRLLVVAVLVGLALLAGPATPASAHAALVGTTPSTGQVVDPAPAEVTLAFTEAVDPVPERTQVIGPDKARADDGAPRSVGKTVRIPLRSGLAKGTYTVAFRVISEDGHPVRGTFSFSIIAPSPGGAAQLDSGAEGNAPMRTALAVARWFGYLGLLLLVGAALVLSTLWPQRLDRRGPLRLAYIGAGVVALATIAEIILQVPYATGSGVTSASRSTWQDVLSSQFGVAHLTRLAVLAVVALLLRQVGRGSGWSADRVLLAVLGVIGLATWSVSGHPAATPVPMVTVLSDMIHIGAMSAWIGGLVMLFAFLLPKATDGELSAIVPVWSRWAGYLVSALILTGVAQALVEVGTVDGLVKTAYGWLVLAKIGLVAIVLAVASLSRQLVAPVAAGTSGAAPRLRRTVSMEAAGLAVVLGVAAVLVQQTPGRTATSPAPTATVQSATLTSQYYSLQVEITPAQAGINEVHLVAFGKDGKPMSVLEWRGQVSLPDQGIENLPIDLLPLTPDHATGQVTLPSAGTWQFSFTLRVSEIDQSTVTADLPVAPA